MPEVAYVNGVYGPIGEATVSIEDRGFQFGDGVYEVVFSYGGKMFLLDAHLQRLQRSLTDIGISYDFDAAPLGPIIEEGLVRSGFSDAMIYLQVTRGVAPRQHAIPRSITPTVVMTFKAMPIFPEEMRESGVKVMSTRDGRWAKCYIKAITLLPNVLAKSEARRRGCYEAVFVTETGEVRECTSSNIYIVRDGRVTTPPRTQSVLHGITQSFLFACAASVGCELKEEVFNFETLRAADEVFVSSTAVEVLGVTTLDGEPIGDGKVGPVTRRMYEAFRRGVRG